MPPIRREGGGWRVGRQRWRDLLFLHQAVPVDVLRRLVPRRLEIDTFEGTAWATLIPFAVLDSRPIGAPQRLGMDFLEVNLRTYVRAPDGEPGIYFFSCVTRSKTLGGAPTVVTPSADVVEGRVTRFKRRVGGGRRRR